MSDHACTLLLRRLPAPDPQPPFDDELPDRDPTTTAFDWHPGDVGPGDREPHAGAGVQGALALAFALPNGIPAEPAAPSAALTRPTSVSSPRLRLVPEPDLADEFGPRPTARHLLPEPQMWSARLVQAMVEVLAGARPLAQLVRWTTADVYEALQRRIAWLAPECGRVTTGQVDVVRSVRVSEPDDGVAEVCAVVQQSQPGKPAPRGSRYRAIALRLEGVDGRWQCTAVHFG